MDRLEELLAEADSPQVHFRDFLIKSRENNILCIVEGIDDPKYYIPRFSSFFGNINEKFNIISVNGKKNVLDLMDLLADRPDIKDVTYAFFVDKDYDSIESTEKLYITPTYSIENLYCTSHSIRSLIVSECQLSKADAVCDQVADEIINIYNEYNDHFHNHPKIINTNIIYMFVRQNLGNRKIPLDSIIKVSVSFKDEILEVHTEKKKNSNLIKEEIININHFKKNNVDWQRIAKDPRSNFRGKEALIFLKCFLKELKPNGVVYKKIHEKFNFEIKLKNQQIIDNTISSMSSYSTTPDCLREFCINLIR